MAKQLAPVALTGGSGFNYEDCVAARFLIDMLAGIAPFGPEFGHVVRLDWQVRDSGRLLDDLAITVETSSGQHTVELSIKSHRQVTAAGFPANFVEAIWEEWFHVVTQVFQRDRDLLALVTGEIANDVSEAWGSLLRESLATSPERMVSRLRESLDPDAGSQSSATSRALFESLKCPDGLRHRGASNDVVTVEVIRRVRLQHFDFRSEPSRDEGRAIADCQTLIRSQDLDGAKKLWETLIAIAAENRGTGGYMGLADLIQKLRPSFNLIDHPDYSADWRSLEHVTRDVLDDIRTDIGRIASLGRMLEVQELTETLSRSRICLSAGESGCGKSALAKMLGAESYDTTIALSPEVFETGGQGRLEELLGLQHPLTEVLTTGRQSCLVLLDAVERFSEKGLRLAGRLIAELLNNCRAHHVHVLLTMQFDATNRVVDRLNEAGIERSKLDIFPISFPPEAAVRELLHQMPNVPWATLHHDMRALLCNLKILDWVVRASQSGDALTDAKVTGLISLIDYLWGRWVEAEHDGIARGGILKKLATIEASTLASGVPLTQLEHTEQQCLTALIASDLLRRRNERIRFSHDLLGDWARLRVLIGEDPTTSSERLQRCAVARWHRAVRLYGRWLLSPSNGVGRWLDALKRADDGSDEGTVVRDLILESVVVSENSHELLSLAWPVLVQEGGQILRRLLDRFLFVATIPDLRLPKLVQDESVAPQVEVAFRVPLWPYWKSLLRILDEHGDEISRLAPIEAAKICRMWLEKTPAELTPGTPFPWRVHAARVSLCVAREMQAQRAEGRSIHDRQDRIAYEAALLSAHDLPDEVSQFALEMANRRPLSPQIHDRAEVARQKAEEEARRRDLEDPERARRIRGLCTPALRVGPLREPWADGPRKRVAEAFREAVLDTFALISLAAVRSNVATEVLLAVCIEEPSHDDPFGGSGLMDDCGLVSWQNGYPALYFRGPFLQLLRTCPNEGIDFVLRLINFATVRWVKEEQKRISRRGDEPWFDDVEDILCVAVQCTNGVKNWWGDHRVFRWYLDWPVDCKLITCSLMALEKWLYEEIDAERDVQLPLQQLMDRSESVAFAGLLIDIGKRAPKYFQTCLRPLLDVSRFYFWESRILLERSSAPTGLMGWWNQPDEFKELAHEWHKARHRQYQLSPIAIWLMLSSAEMEDFFCGCRERWQRELETESPPPSLEFLIERFDRKNYKTTAVGDGKVQFEFVLPKHLAQQVEDEQQASDDSMRLLTFPTDCRRILDGERELPEDGVSPFWDTLQLISQQSPPDDDSRSRQADAISGGVAVLLRLHFKWLECNSARMTWCLDQLQKVATDPHPRREFDCPESAGDWGWDCFVAEAGACLLPDFPENSFVRELVANGVTGYHYGTTRKTMHLVFQFRHSLADDFSSLQHLGARWSVVRRLRRQSEHYVADFERWEKTDVDSSTDSQAVDQLRNEAERWRKEHAGLIEQFVSGSVASFTLREAGEMGAGEVVKLETIRFPARHTQPPESTQQSWYGTRHRVRRKDIGIDAKVLQEAFFWLELSSAQSDGERKVVLCHVRDLLGLVLNSLQPDFDPDTDVEENSRTDGTPNEFDGWVFGRVARAIVQMRDDEQPSSLWQPILGLKSHAHEWTKRFFWYWFSDAVEASPTPEVFAGRWIEMIEFALASPLWELEALQAFDLDDLVFELLGYHFGMHSIAASNQFAPILEKMIPLFDAAATRGWFAMPQVANGLARSLKEPGYDRLLCPGIRWLHNALPDVSEYNFWRQRDIESNLISVLNRCWERHYESVSADSELQSAFLGLLTALASRGSHAALALRERLLDSISRSD